MKIDTRYDLTRCIGTPMRAQDGLRRCDGIAIVRREGRAFAVATDYRECVAVPISLERGDVEGVFPKEAVADGSAVTKEKRIKDATFPVIDNAIPRGKPSVRVILDPARLLNLARALGTPDRVELELRESNDPIIARGVTPFAVDDSGAFGLLMPIFSENEEKAAKRRKARKRKGGAK